jgi:serine/threonine protein kinase
MLNKIKAGKIMFPDRKKYNFKFSDEIEDLIRGLLRVNVNDRIGSKEDSIEVLAHPVFHEIDFNEL